MHLGVAAHQVTPGKAAIGQSLGGHDKPRLHRSIVKAPGGALRQQLKSLSARLFHTKREKQC
jgi:hypothetical protein